MKKYKAIFERDETGAWLVRVPRLPGCHSYGRTLEQARRRIREVVELWIDDAGDVVLQEEIRLPIDVKTAIARSRRARERAQQENENAQHLTRDAAYELVDDLGLSLRDAGELLGLSHQRVQQLVRTGIAGIVEGSAGDSASVDEVVYGPRGRV
jgi:predicted RNase H-like HicB family nuclease